MRVLLPLAAFTSCLLLASTVVSRTLRDAPLSVRLAASVCLLYGVGAWAFQILGLAGAFSLTVVVPIFVVLPPVVVWWQRKAIVSAVSVGHADCRDEFTAIAQAMRHHPVALTGVGIIGAHVLLRLARALVMPRLGWDDFTYHLFRAGRWVQNSGITLDPAPDAWSYYEFFPWGGDLIWAWSLIWRGAGETVVAIAAVVSWAICLPLAYGLARRFEQPPLPSLLAAAALVLLPSQITQIATAYVDNLQLMLMLACALLLVEALQAGRASPRRMTSREYVLIAVLLGLGCGLGTLVKLSFLPFAAMIAFAITWDSIRGGRGRGVLAFAAGATIVVPNFAFNWVHRGSPFYPFHVLDSLPYNEQLAELLSRQQGLNTTDRLLSALIALVTNVRPPDPFLNIGFAGLFLLLLGMGGAGYGWFKPRARLYLVCVGVSAVVTVGQLLSPSNAALVTLWGRGLGRFLVPAVAPILLLAGTFGAALRVVLLPLLTAEYFLYAPWEWPAQVLQATGVAFTVLGALAVATLAVARYRSRSSWAFLALTIVGSVSVIDAVHGRMRYSGYRAIASGELNDFHRAAPVGTWPIWLRLEEIAPARVAMAAGWDGIGHNWFGYGLLGERLQHDVRYIPVSADGTIVDYRDYARLQAHADRHAWLTRLAEQRIEWVVLLGPRTLEHEWLDELPDVFSIELTLEDRAGILARVNRTSLSRHVRSAQ
jgi:hypothetical protein